MAVFAGLAGSLVLWVGAFGWLLGARYSPTHYRAGAVVPDLVEFAWAAGALAVAMLTAATAWRRRDLARRWLRASWPLTVVSALLLVAAGLGRSRELYAVILYATALGWTVARAWRPGPTARLIRPLAILLVVGGALLGSYYFRQQVTDWRDLTLGYHGIGENVRVLQNTASRPHELFLRVNPEYPLFFDHVVPGVLPLVPLWALWPTVKLLMVLQVLTTLGIGGALYLIGRHFLTDRIAALLLAGSWLLHPSSSQLIYDGSYGFTWTSLCLPLFSFALVLWLRGRAGWALVLALWAVLIKEESAIPIGMFGLYFAWRYPPRWRGFVLAGAMFGYFLLVSAVLLPALAGDYMVQSYYAHLGTTKLDILSSPVLNPQVFWGTLFEPATFYFAAMLLAPLLFLPLRKPSILLVGSLTFLAVCLFSGIETKSVGRQYQIALVPVLYWALAAGLAGEDPARPQESVAGRLAGVCTACLALSVFCGNTPWSKDNRIVRRMPGRLATVQEVSAGLDPAAYLVTTPRAAAHFIGQRYLSIIPYLPPAADEILLDFRDTWKPVLDLERLRDLRAFQREVERGGQFVLAAARDGILRYRRQGPPLDRRARVERNALPPDAGPLGFDAGHGIRVVAGAGTGHRLRLFLRRAATGPADLAGRAQVRMGSEIYQSDWQPLGQGIWPVGLWEPDQLYAEEFPFELPAGLAIEPHAIGLELAPL